jgi:hypothetical protein
MNDDDDVFDERGVLKPGRSMRVATTAMDAAVIGLDRQRAVAAPAGLSHLGRLVPSGCAHKGLRRNGEAR